jgi:hypothetical protein
MAYEGTPYDPHKPYPGLITGLEIIPSRGRGRPKHYINATARKLHARLIEVERLLAELATKTGFLPAHEKMMRGRLYGIANQLNRNKLKVRKRNPVDYCHRLSFIGADGFHHPICGARSKGRMVEGVRVSGLCVSECDAIVDCPECRRANYVDVNELRT